MVTIPFLSVIVPVWNSADLIAKCLTAIGAQTYARDLFEVLVVDNGSTDATREVVRTFPFARLLSEPVAGSYRARNCGLREAQGEYVLFTDADCIPDPGWLSAAARAAKELPPFGILGGRITLFRSGKGGSKACEAYEYLIAFDQQRKLASGQCATANWLSPKALLIELGGFDATLKSGGDTSLAKRIVALGYTLAYVDDMIVSHPMRSTSRELVAKTRRAVGGKWSSKERNRLANTLASILIGTIHRAGIVFGSTRIGIIQKIAVLRIIIVLMLASIGEVFRLSFGGEPRRA